MIFRKTIDPAAESRRAAQRLGNCTPSTGSEAAFAVAPRIRYVGCVSVKKWNMMGVGREEKTFAALDFCDLKV